MKRWLVEGSYQLSENSKEIVFSGVDAEKFAPYLLYDYSRFSFASHESIVLSFQKSFDKRALAWGLLKRYYSGFFAAHSLLRSLGHGVLWVDAADASHLQKTARIYIRDDFLLPLGAYKFDFKANNGYDATLKIEKIGSRGGSHEEFWKYFLKFMIDYSNDLVTRNAPDAGQFAARMTDLKRIMCARGENSGTWLSFIRNEINYQQKFGTWFPFSSAKKSRLQESNILKLGNAGSNLLINPQSSPIEAFSSATCFLALINMDLANLLKARAGAGASQFRREWDRLNVALS